MLDNNTAIVNSVYCFIEIVIVLGHRLWGIQQHGRWLPPSMQRMFNADDPSFRSNINNDIRWSIWSYMGLYQKVRNHVPLVLYTWYRQNYRPRTLKAMYPAPRARNHALSPEIWQKKWNNLNNVSKLRFNSWLISMNTRTWDMVFYIVKRVGEMQNGESVVMYPTLLVLFVFFCCVILKNERLYLNF